MGSLISLILSLYSTLLEPKEETLILEPDRISYLLSYPFAVQGTLELQDLQLSYEIIGETLLLHTPPSETLYVQARYMVLADTSIGTFREHEPLKESSFQAADSSVRQAATVSTDRLQVHGAKTFAISLNDAGVSDVDQGLTVDVSGALGEVDVKAHITDEEGSFVPEGTTERIEEFDRISIGLSEETWNLGLGDLDLVYPFGTYGTIERRLKGTIGDLSIKKLDASGAFGIEGTRRGHDVLEPEDGKRGPYFIGDPSSQQPVIPSSERVWLDGALLERGTDKDYTIDYSTGELFFTNIPLIDANSKIEVDYSYTGADYRSNNELAGFRLGPFQGIFYREADSRTHLFHSWSAEQEAILDTVTDSEAVLPGARYVGSNQGSYVMEDGHYTWVGPAAGDYDVSFRRLDSTGTGDYVLDSDSGFFRFVGEGQGDYRAEILTTLPSQEEALGLSINNDLGAFSLSAGGIVSRRTPNLYNEENRFFGHSHRIRASVGDEKLEASLSHRLQTPEVWVPADGVDADTRDRWNMDSLPKAFNEQNLGLSFKPSDSFSMLLTAGHLWTADHRFATGFASSAPFFDLRTDWLITERERLYAGLHPRLGIFTPVAALSFEHYTLNLPHTRNIEPLLGVSLNPLSKLTVGANLSRRIDQKKDSIWQDTLYYDRLGTTADWDGDVFQFAANAGIERYTPLDAGQGSTGQKWQAIYADVRTSYLPNPGIRLSGDFAQHLTRTQNQIVDYIPVEPGTGEYVRDPETDEYVPQENGDYRKEVRFEESTVPEIEHTASIGAQFTFDVARLWANLSYLDGPSSRSVLASGRTVLFPTENLINLILEPSYRNQNFPSWGQVEEGLEGWDTRVELRSRVHPDYLLRIEGSYGEETRTRANETLRFRGEQSASFFPMIDLWLRLEPRIGFGALTAEEPLYYPELGVITIRKVWAGLDLEKTFKGLKLSIGSSVTQRQPNVAADALPYLITKDDPAGLLFSWRAEAERYLAKGLSLRLKYEGNLYPDERGLENELELSAGMYF